MTGNFIDNLNNLKSEIVLCKTYDEKLKVWAQFTVDYCDSVARTQIDRSFYAFQSEPFEEPDVLILGLNPNDLSNYQSQYDNSKWGLKDWQKMIPEVFIRQNPWYLGGQYADPTKPWNILSKMNKTIHVQPDLSRLFDKMVYLNILYFGSTDFKEFQNSFKEHWKEVYDNCIALSSILIFDIIKPKRIICLGIENCFKQLIDGSITKELINGSLYKTEKNGIDIYGMTHPSARTSNFFRETIGWHLYSNIFGRDVINWLKNNISNINQALIELTNEYKLKLIYDPVRIQDRFGEFRFCFPNNNEIWLSFEFQNSFCSDLRYELRKNISGKNKFINPAKKCQFPYTDWINFEYDFNKDDCKRYFEKIIKKSVLEYKQLVNN